MFFLINQKIINNIFKINKFREHIKMIKTILHEKNLIDMYCFIILTDQIYFYMTFKIIIIKINKFM